MRQFFRSVMVRLYLGLLSFYPSSFRSLFKDEIREIFLDVVDEADRAGGFGLLDTSIRELKSIFISVICEHWHVLKPRKELTMASDNGSSNSPVFEGDKISLMSASPPGWRWILRWTLLTTAAILAGWLLRAPFTALLLLLYNLGAKIGIVSAFNSDTLELVGFFCGFALSYATSQWVMLRKYLPRVRSWFLGTGIGLLVAGILLGIFVMVWGTFIPFGSAVFFLLIGTVVGIAQWVVLRKVLQNAIWILVIDILAAGSYLLGGRSITSYIELIIILMLPGLFTGVGIWMLLKQSQPASAEKERELISAVIEQRTKKWFWVLAGLVSLLPLFFAFSWFHATLKSN